MAVATTRLCSADIAFKDITHCVTVAKTQKVILNHVDGEFKHGKLHAIMGPSGAGKSSLLNVLAGLNFVANGTVTLNDQETYPVAKWSKVVTPIRSYILQDDYLVPELSVRETLLFAAAMNRPPKEGARHHAKLVDCLLEQMGLTELGARRICALSGGQRKRVSVASELVNFKPILFLDEPTTGLDSASCYRLIDLLKSVAKAGCNVIATIHQPSSRVFTMFDTLTVLATGGRLAYSGPPYALAGSIERLTNTFVPPLDNPADFLFEGDTIEKMAQIKPDVRLKAIEAAVNDFENSHAYERFKVYISNLEGDTLKIAKKPFKNTKKTHTASSHGSSEEVLEICEHSQPTMSERFKTLFKRSVIHSLRDKVFLLGRFIAFVFGAAVVGLTFQSMGNDATKTYSNVAFLFLLTKIFLLGSSIVTIMNSPIHLHILLRENINGWYNVRVFFWARTFIEATVNIAVSIIFSVAMWMMTMQQQSPALALPYLIVVILIHSITTHHFSFIIAMFANEASLPQLPFAICLLNVIFGGYFVPLENLPMWIFWMRYVNFGSFTFSALLKIAYAPFAPDYKTVELPCSKSDPKIDPQCARFQTGENVLQFWHVDHVADPLWRDILALILYMVGFALIHWALLAVYLSRARRSVARI